MARNSPKTTPGLGGPKKQQSLMLFFKPMKPPSSPLVKKGHPDSDKENDTSMMQESTDTPLTSETGELKKEILRSSPVTSPTKGTASKQPKSVVKTENARPAAAGSGTSGKRKTVSYAESDNSDDEEGPVLRKRKKVVESDDEDDFKPDGEDIDEDEDAEMSDVVAELNGSPGPVEELASEDEELPAKPTTESVTPNNILGSKFNASSSYKATAKLKTPVVKSKPKPKKSFEKENEERYQWLVDVRDAAKRTPGDPQYDPRTLYIPSSAWAKFTAFERQYWEIKHTMWDTVVFFKKGKFYELYENDAVIANTKFDLKIAGGGRANMKLAGIPEMSFEYWAKEFISHGYKIARVDQKESLLAKEMRGGTTKEEKIIKRELTAVLTGGTLTDLDMITDDMATYCLSIKESFDKEGNKLFGVCFVDTATSALNFIELVDDDECTKLDTLITQVKPKEVICEKNNLSSLAYKIIKFNAHSTHQLWNTLNPLSEFWDADTAEENLVKAKYYEAEDLDDFSNYPAVLLKFKDNHPVAFNAFGGLFYYLRQLKLDESIMTLANFKEYNISMSTATHMLLDGVTLTNLEILNNTFDGTEKGTLFKLLNRAITPFGKRKLRNWVLHPLMRTEDINARLDSVEFFMNKAPELRVELETALNSLPDLERLIARVHSKTLRFRDFLKVIEGFEKISRLFKSCADYDLSGAGHLQKILETIPVEIHNLVASWEEAFDREKATLNEVVPQPGVDSEYDASSGRLSELEDQLQKHLRVYKKEYKSHEICYRDSGKELFLIEVPVKVKNIPRDWQQMGATAKVKRYWSPEVKVLVRELMEQKETHKSVCETLINRMYARFDVNYKTWLSVVSVVSKIDALIALTKTSETIGYPSCRPQFESRESGFLEFTDLRHPCFVGTGEFIPNDVMLGDKSPRFGLLTGANAAGKSTLMRTTALAVILAQIGCYVPASSASMTPVDKIMTRLGANDNIMQGKSTFFVELSETKKILSNATSHSLIILDELGRGGSSSDGYAIAEAVLHHLATHVQPLGFFATHYGSLGLSFINHPQIKPVRMAINVEQSSRNITFLYKLEDGTASGSFGMNVAAMCGISAEIVDKAEVAAREYEQTSRLKDAHEAQHANKLSVGLQSDVAWLALKYDLIGEEMLRYNESEKQTALATLFTMIESL